MAKGKGSIQGWITKNGVHIPIYGEYTVRGGVEPKAKGAKWGKKKRFDKASNGAPRVTDAEAKANKVVEFDGQKYQTQPVVDWDRNKDEEYVAGHLYVPVDPKPGKHQFFVANEDGSVHDSGTDYLNKKNAQPNPWKEKVEQKKVEAGNNRESLAQETYGKSYKDLNKNQQADLDRYIKNPKEYEDDNRRINKEGQDSFDRQRAKEKLAKDNAGRLNVDNIEAGQVEGKKPVTKVEEKQARQSFRDKKAQEQGFADYESMESYNEETGVNEETWKEQESSTPERKNPVRKWRGGKADEERRQTSNDAIRNLRDQGMGIQEANATVREMSNSERQKNAQEWTDKYGEGATTNKTSQIPERKKYKSDLGTNKGSIPTTVSGLRSAYNEATGSAKAAIASELRRKGYSLVGGKWVKGKKS